MMIKAFNAMRTSTHAKLLATTALGASLMLTSVAAQAELSANASITNNYLWRGLTQSVNLPATQGGIDYSADNGFYVGTWISNVEYDAGDAFSYEHDVYFGYSGEAGGIGYDGGYLYFNYDANAEFDFSEVYGSLSFGAFTVGAQILADTEAAEGVGQDFGFGQATYIYGDYAIELANEAELSFHVGRHAGDFVEAFNGTTDDYLDYGVTLAKDGFAFTISGTTLGSDDNNDGEEDYASMSARDNDNIKFVLSYSGDFAL